MSHIAFFVDDVAQTYEEVKDSGISFLDQPVYVKESGRTVNTFVGPLGEAGFRHQFAHQTTRGEYEDFK